MNHFDKPYTAKVSGQRPFPPSRPSSALPVRTAHTSEHRGAAPPPYLNVLDFGASGDNSTDNTGPFQAAIDAAQAAGGGVVYAPPGLYLFLGSVQVPPGVSLQGSYSSVPSHCIVCGDTLNDGTVLMPTANRGNDSASPFITVNMNAALHGSCQP